MKKSFMSFRLIITVVIATFLLSSCGGGEVSTNEHLSSLPGMAKKYSEKIDNLEKEIKENTDQEEAFKLDKEKKLLKEEAEKAIEEYLTKNPITDVPFEQKADYQFKINKVWVENASLYRINYIANVTITSDIVNEYGNPKKHFFAFVIAVDKEGKSLTRKPGVLGNDWGNRGPFKANMEVEMKGSLDGPMDMADFENLVFISREDYDEAKKFKSGKHE